jgi:hypothetical protein
MADSSSQLEWYPIDERQTHSAQAPGSGKVVCLIPNRQEINNRQRLAQAARVRKNLQAKFSNYRLLERRRKIDLELNRAVREY